MLDAIPYLGSGLGFRAALRASLLAAADRVDCVEILVDRHLGSPHAEADLEAVAARFDRVIAHGVGLSVASAMTPDRAYLLAVKRLCDRLRAPLYSEHLAVSRAPGLNVGGLSPVWRTEETLARTVANVRQVQAVVERPLVLETITEVVALPGHGMSTPEFFGRLVEATGCGILLDLTNLHINAHNHGFDAVAVVDAMPLEAVVYVHLAGGIQVGDVLVDGHCRPVHREVWPLLEHLVARAPIRGTIIEHDVEFPPFEELLAQVERARGILAGVRARAGRRVPAG